MGEESVGKKGEKLEGDRLDGPNARAENTGKV